MSPSRPFILRPVATSLLMAAILLVGIVAYTQLPVSALPQVDYPTIQVLTFYPGASPDVMATTVTAPLERQFGQMQGLSQMTSTSAGGVSVVVLQFVLTLQHRHSGRRSSVRYQSAQSVLPSNLPAPPVYSKTNPADAPVLTLAITSDTCRYHKWKIWSTRACPEAFPAQRRRNGHHQRRPKARGSHSGQPGALSSYGINLEAVRTALTPASVNSAKGNFDGPRQDYQIDANDQLVTSPDYEKVESPSTIVRRCF